MPQTATVTLLDHLTLLVGVLLQQLVALSLYSSFAASYGKSPFSNGCGKQSLTETRYVCWKTGLHGREPSRAEKLRRAETFNRLANPTPREQWQSAVLKGKDLPLQSFTMNQDSWLVSRPRPKNLYLTDTGFSTICLEVVKDSDNIRPLPCSHMFHQQCFDEWFWTTNQPNKCPLCRTDFIDSSKWPTKPGPPYFVDSMVPGIG
jgi:hypothetical protein